VVSILVEYDSQLNAKDALGETALLKSARNLNVSVAQRLTAAGADYTGTMMTARATGDMNVLNNDVYAV